MYDQTPCAERTTKDDNGINFSLIDTLNNADKPDAELSNGEPSEIKEPVEDLSEKQNLKIEKKKSKKEQKKIYAANAIDEKLLLILGLYYVLIVK